MIDADGSGAIDVEEMQEAFNFLGMNMSKKVF
jgi:Ca2+-binding EF-hand superfamily protein